MKLAHKDITTPPGQINNMSDVHKLAVEARALPRATKLGDIIDRVQKQEALDAVERAYQRGKQEGYTQGYYDGVIDERHKWINQNYHQDKE